MLSGYAWRTAGITVTAVLLVYAYISHLTFSGTDDSTALTKDKPKHFRAPRVNIWAELSEDEVEDLLFFLYNVPNNLNLTRPENATAWDNHIALVEAFSPNKTDAVSYLNGASDLPHRYARVVVNQGATDMAGIFEYLVGPLPAGPETIVEPLTFCYNSGHNYVLNPLPDYQSIIEWFVALGNDMSDMIEDLLGEARNPGHVPGVPPLMALSRPAAFENGTVTAWAAVHSPGYRFDAWSLLPQGLYCRYDITGRDSTKWKLYEWYYNGIMYEDTKAFRKAWEEGKVIKTPLNLDGEWSAAEPAAHGIPGREKGAPIAIQPFGPRFDIDEENRFVSWMGFEFYISERQATALSLWDIKFKGDQIMYELGLQEAMAHYAGDDPMQVGMVWLDTLFGMGFNMYELVQGYDCPQYATYLSTTFHRGDRTFTRNNAICIFEHTADHALQRHVTAKQVTITKNTYLVVRSVSTVGNYDYTIDYLFYLDGSIEVKYRASGYIFGAYHALEAARAEMDGKIELSRNEKRDEGHYQYGYRIHDTLMTSMHDHVLNFKADLDIAGPYNSLYRIDIKPHTHRYEWEDKPRKTMRLLHNRIQEETALNWPANSGAMYVVVNNQSRNTWGERRGYRITPGTGMGTPPHLTIEDPPTMPSANKWTQNDLFVLKQKDEERKSVSEYNSMEPVQPLVDFNKMLNDENIADEDLVVYFNLGTHHIPHTGDIPNTLMHWSTSSVMFVPHNFHDRDPSRESAQGVRLDLKEQGMGSKVKYFGPKFEKDVTLKVVSFKESNLLF
jgi:primary-amine oxidase